jgi:cyclopropane-fatty-acyl-phospholipid synthase
VVDVRSPRALAHALRAPGQLGLSRAYVSGELGISDLDALIALIGDWRPSAIDAATKRRLIVAAVRATGLVRLPQPPAVELRPRGRRHSGARGGRAVRHFTSRMTSLPSSSTRR